MKSFFSTIFLLFFFSAFSQNSTLDVIDEDANVAVHAMKFSVNSSEAFKTINWKEIKDSFKENKPEELIELTFEIDLPDSENKFKSTFTVAGKSKDIDSLIKKVKKGILTMSKIASN